VSQVASLFPFFAAQWSRNVAATDIVVLPRPLVPVFHQWHCSLHHKQPMIYSPSSSNHTQSDTHGNAQIGPHERTCGGQKLADIEGLAFALEKQVWVSTVERAGCGSRVNSQPATTSPNRNSVEARIFVAIFSVALRGSMSSVVVVVTPCAVSLVSMGV
jgi:hypothetical protein